MSLFNKLVPNYITNEANGIAFKINFQEELFRLVTTSFLNDTFYKTKEEELSRLQDLIQECLIIDPAFVLWLAETARIEYNMRTTTHVLIWEIVKTLKGENFKLKDFIYNSITRVDDMVEILSYILPEGKSNKKDRKWKLSHSLVKAYKQLLWFKTKKWIIVEWKFNEYQLAKYNRKGKINLKDLVVLSHSNSILSWKILNNELKTPFTWEVEISKLDKNDYLKRFEVWNRLLSEKKLPYMALLRNLRNISNDYIEYAKYNNLTLTDIKKSTFLKNTINYLTNKEVVLKSKQMPFRYLSAYKTMKELKKDNDNEDSKTNLIYNIFISWIKIAATHSVKNLEIKWKTAIFADVSYSMESPVSSKSKINCIDIALLFWWMTKVMSKNSISWIFWDQAKLKDLNGDSVFEMNDNYKKWEVWYATNWYKSIDLLLEKEIKVDKIFLFTDMELYWDDWMNDSKSKTQIDKSLIKYRKKYWNVKVYIFNLSSSSTDVSNQNWVYTISGWSDKIFDYIDVLDNMGKKDHINNIRKKWEKYLIK